MPIDSPLKPPLLSSRWEDVLPTDDDVRFYREHGYYISRRILPESVIDDAVRGAERHWAGERDWRLPIGSGFADWRYGDPDGLRNSEYTALQNREIRRLVQYPTLGAVAARLTGAAVIRLWDDQLISKPPSTGPSGPVVGWHTDRAYWLSCTSEEMLTAWIPLQDTPAEMGPVVYIEGSHRWPGTDDMRGFSSTELAAVEARYAREGVTVTRRVVALEKGQVAFHHSRMIHGSDVNRGDRPRLSIALHLQDDSNRYRLFTGDDGRPWRTMNENLARTGEDGLPDYTDPAVFPVLWPLDEGSRA